MFIELAVLVAIVVTMGPPVVKIYEWRHDATSCMDPTSPGSAWNKNAGDRLGKLLFE
jgi:hypothetical protein